MIYTLCDDCVKKQGPISIWVEFLQEKVFTL